ncbi:hypothetical protein T459_23318 [Capsicum annuum]|uniref:Uncharacterized protein n=1 Tax=Capsicum annuum TaxID=4072 RepID=A0A1U8E4C1_CAPAN|nr:uncharacterized protein LOC107842664 [Capsicum annuum]KAF3677636.1 putative GPI transamidase component PIG-T-like [Capsicum annuum]PHT72533.1 hypothetical protein T459_23318 [Capsicum annuum]
MREIKLLCPSISKIVVSIMVWEEERLDLGSIARVFGLDPSTLKINGHFISRGVDLIASSVTWKSLLSFFSARGFSTAPLIVEGKLSEVGSKRSHSPAEVDKGLLWKKELNDEREKHHEDSNSLGNKKFKESARGVRSNLKRKLSLEGSGLFKRSRTNEYYSGSREEPVDFPKADRARLCSLASEKLKRIRDDEMVVTNPFKRIR